MAYPGRVAESTVDEWRATIEVNVVGAGGADPRTAARAAAGASGHVVFINSGAGHNVSPGLASYSASKFALRAFADSLRADEPALRVTSVHPGRIDTDMQRDLVAYEGGDYQPADVPETRDGRAGGRPGGRHPARRPTCTKWSSAPVGDRDILGVSFRRAGIMATLAETAKRFFDECEAGHGWAKCGQYCHPGAAFTAQADTLSDMGTLEAYTEWMKGLMQLLPDGVAEVRSFAVDESRNNVVVFGVFRGTHTGEGGPVPATGKSAAADYVYVMDFDGDKIRHLTKI